MIITNSKKDIAIDIIMINRKILKFIFFFISLCFISNFQKRENKNIFDIDNKDNCKKLEI